MISVRIDDISNRLYAVVFKIYVRGFWFIVTAFFNNIYVITIKQFRKMDPKCFFFNF